MARQAGGVGEFAGGVTSSFTVPPLRSTFRESGQNMDSGSPAPASEAPPATETCHNGERCHNGEPCQSGEPRHIGLDALRGLMMMLGIVLHASMLYMQTPPPAAPFPTDRNNAYAFDLIFDFIHAFRMPAFFVLAGFFTALLVAKRGLRGTWRNRVSRILLPLIASLVLILPVTGLLMLSFFAGARFSTHDLIPDLGALQTLGAEIAAKTGQDPARPALGHLWFLYYLCMFYALIPACLWLTQRSERHSQAITRPLRSPQSFALCFLVLTFWTAATLWPFKGGQVHEGFVYFTPHLPSLVYYGSFFVSGFLFHTQREFLQAARQRLPFMLVLAGIAFPVSVFLSALDHAARGASLELHVYSVLTNALATWALICLFIGGALRYFDRPSAWIDYTAQSSYWVFLVHMPLVCLAGWWLLPYDLPAVLKFVLVCAFTALCAFVTFHYWVQQTWISDFLHGRRFKLAWPWLAAARRQ